ncbi:hypothetical protein AXH09_11085 [Pseudomonas aeruginosa]|nr:hypothetical protein AXH09_11085 [Pseudomonas aeruginosa]
MLPRQSVSGAVAEVQAHMSKMVSNALRKGCKLKCLPTVVTLFDHCMVQEVFQRTAPECQANFIPIGQKQDR